MVIFQLIQKPQFRGAEMFAAQLSTHMEKLGHTVFLISLYSGDINLPYLGSKIALNRPLSKRFSDLKGWKEFSELIQKHKPDVVQANAADTLKFAVLAKLIYRWKTQIIFRNANKIGDFIDSKPKYFLNKFFMDRVAHVISVSELCKEDFIHTFKFNFNRVDTVEIGINLTEIGELPADLTHIYNRGPVLLNVASLVKEKNHKGLLRIFKSITESIPDAQLVIIGNGTLKCQLDRLTTELEITGNVHFIGGRNDVLEIVKHSNAFLLPSHIEGLPGVILEAQFCKVPVVAYNVGGISEVVQTNRTGYLIEKDNEDEFISAIKTCLNVSQQNTDMINAAYQQVTHNFDNTKIASRFLNVYEKVLKTNC